MHKLGLTREIVFQVILIVTGISCLTTGPQLSLKDAWESPPHQARLGAYWWWLNGNVTKEAITRDLEAMKEMGFGSAVIFDADGASQDGNDMVPAGPTFATPLWRELFKHTDRNHPQPQPQHPERME